MGSSYDFVVIGAGIGGSFLALELSKKSKVVIVDKQGILSGATAASSEIITLQLPKPFINWALESIEMYESVGAPIRRIEAILATKEKCAERYLRILNSANVKTWVLTRQEAMSESGLNIKYIEDYVFLATLDALVDVGTLSNVLRYLLDSNEVRIIEGKKAHIVNDEVIVGEERFKPTSGIVVSAGAWTSEVVGRDVAGSRIYKCEAHSVEIGKRVKTIFYEDSSDTYLVPESPKTVVVGDGRNEVISEPEEGFIPRPGSVYEVLEGLAKVITDIERAVPRTSWAAPCIVTGDGWPAVGRIYDNVYILTGFNGVGLMIAPALARILAKNLLANKPIPSKLDPLRSVRPWKGPPEEPPEPYRMISC